MLYVYFGSRVKQLCCLLCIFSERYIYIYIYIYIYTYIKGGFDWGNLWLLRRTWSFLAWWTTIHNPVAMGEGSGILGNPRGGTGWNARECTSSWTCTKTLLAPPMVARESLTGWQQISRRIFVRGMLGWYSVRRRCWRPRLLQKSARDALPNTRCVSDV